MLRYVHIDYYNMALLIYFIYVLFSFIFTNRWSALEPKKYKIVFIISINTEIKYFNKTDRFSPNQISVKIW